MNKIQKLKNKYGSRVIEVSLRSDLPRNIPLVYILFYGEHALVVGEGEYSRACVITDDLNSITPNHKKALKVRLYRLYGCEKNTFTAFLIECESRIETRRIEKDLHGLIGGNDSKVDSKILEMLFNELKEHSLVWLLLKQALCSAFDGISDLKRWRRNNIIEDKVWIEICERLKINYKMPNNPMYVEIANQLNER